MLASNDCLLKLPYLLHGNAGVVHDRHSQTLLPRRLLAATLLALRPAARLAFCLTAP
jgi:hypothetical protein